MIVHIHTESCLAAIRTVLNLQYMINWGIGERVGQESFRLMFSPANKNPLVSLLPDTFNIRSNGHVITKTANK